MSRIRNLWKIAKKVNWAKTLWINLHYFKMADALRMPVFVYWRTKFNRCRGQIILQGRIHPGMLRIGIP